VFRFRRGIVFAGWPPAADVASKRATGGDLWLYELGASHPRQLTFSAVATLHPTLIPPSQVAEALRQAGKVVEAHYYPNEGHGFAKRENQIDSIRRTIA
jgi:acetyl esterase/lipase